MVRKGGNTPWEGARPCLGGIGVGGPGGQLEGNGRTGAGPGWQKPGGGSLEREKKGDNGRGLWD